MFSILFRGTALLSLSFLVSSCPDRHEELPRNTAVAAALPSARGEEFHLAPGETRLSREDEERLHRFLRQPGFRAAELKLIAWVPENEDATPAEARLLALTDLVSPYGIETESFLFSSRSGREPELALLAVQHP